MSLDVWRLTLSVVGWNPFAMVLQCSKGHHKCKHPVNPTNYMYLDNRVLSLSVLLAGHYMVGGFMYAWILNCMFNCMIKTFFTLAYPFCLFMCLACDFLLLRWPSIYWCEQMWELLVVIRVMETPLHSLTWIGFPFSKFSFKTLWPMYCPTLWAYILYTVKLVSRFVNGIVVCLSFFPSICWITVRSDIYAP